MTENTEEIVFAKVALAIGSIFSAIFCADVAPDYGFAALAGVICGFFGYALGGLATFKLNSVIWTWAFGPTEERFVRDRRATFIALWPFVTAVSLTICPLVILVNAVI